MTPLQHRYRREGLRKGLTVAEWEAANGLPHYSVYPECRDVASLRHRGFFMYRNATRAERTIVCR